MNAVIDLSLSSVGKSEWLRGFPLNLSTRILYHISFKKSTDFNMFFKYFLKNFRAYRLFFSRRPRRAI